MDKLMEKSKNLITQAELKNVLRYEPTTGIFTWRRNLGQRARAGGIAGSYHNQGYRCIKIKGEKYQAHRLAVLYMTGAFPKDQVDHANQVKDDNRWSNLRECTKSQNNINVILRKDNTSGYKGVCKNYSKWMASISYKGASVHIGLYTDILDAARAYDAKAKELFGDYAYLNGVDI
jgi:hypothetical protein